MTIVVSFSVSAQNQALYGGRMTTDRLIAVRNATTEAIDHLHHSLESCPSAEAEAQDPKGIKARDIVIMFIRADITTNIMYTTDGLKRL